MAKDKIQEAVERATAKPLGGLDRHAEEMSRTIGRAAHEYRFEVSIASVLAAIYGALALAAHQRPAAAAVQMLVPAVGLATFGPSRRALLAAHAGARLRRRWDRTMEHCAVPGRARILGVDRIWSGYRVRMRVSHGLSFDWIVRNERLLSASMRVGEIRIKCEEGNASEGVLTLKPKNPLLNWRGERWPVLDMESHSLWDPIRIGLDEFGDPADVVMRRHMLVGGITGGGKSVMVSMPLAVAALDPTVRLFLLDAKGGLEFAPWAPCAEAFAKTIEEGIAVLAQVQTVMHHRLGEMVALGESERRVIRDVQRDSGWPLIFVAIDELARFTEHGNKKLRDEFNGLLEDIIALGRAPGVVILAATQKPEGSVVPTRIRDMFPYRMAFRCSSRQASDTILGSDMAGLGFNAQRISEKEKGVGFLLSEGSSPALMRTYFLDDENIFTLAELAREKRQLCATNN